MEAQATAIRESRSKLEALRVLHDTYMYVKNLALNAEVQ